MGDVEADFWFLLSVRLHMWQILQTDMRVVWVRQLLQKISAIESTGKGGHISSYHDNDNNKNCMLRKNQKFF